VSGTKSWGRSGWSQQLAVSLATSEVFVTQKKTLSNFGLVVFKLSFCAQGFLLGYITLEFKVIPTLCSLKLVCKMFLPKS
jgi:hypothetical protein